MSSFRRLLGLILIAALAPTLAWADAPRRVLHVSLYPYIPNAAAAALTLKQGFERDHPDVIVDITLNPHYYDLDPAAKGILYEDADVHEIDVVFLGDFLTQHKLAPLSKALQASLGPYTARAAEAATVDGQLVAAPQWLCSDFLIYRADQTGLDSSDTLSGMEAALAPAGHGLLMDMGGKDGLGELYLSFLVARDGQPDKALASVTPAPDPVVLDRIQRILALEPAGFGRSADYHERGVFYARQFARRSGAAFVGYSEMIHEVLDEGAVSCRVEDRCVGAGDIRVAAFPFEDHKVRPMVWVDMFGVDAKTTGQTRTDAEAFIGYAVSDAAYRALLIPQAGEAPRYLLPATEAPFHDPQILAAAPLYPKFHAIIDQGVVVSTPHLTAKLHDVAEQIDAALPKTH